MIKIAVNNLNNLFYNVNLCKKEPKIMKIKEQKLFITKKIIIINNVYYPKLEKKIINTYVNLNEQNYWLDK